MKFSNEESYETLPGYIGLSQAKKRKGTLDSWSSLGRWWHHNPPPASREDIRPSSPPLPCMAPLSLSYPGEGALPPREKEKRKKEVKPLLPFLLLLLLLLLLPREEGKIYGHSEDATPGGSITRAYALIFPAFSFTCRKRVRSFVPDRRKRAFCRMWDAVCCVSVGVCPRGMRRRQHQPSNSVVHNAAALSESGKIFV